MDRTEAVHCIHQSLVALRAMPGVVEDIDAFTRWRVQTNVALRTLVGQTAPEFKLFCTLAYAREPVGTGAVTRRQAADRYALVVLLETVHSNLNLVSGTA